MHWEKKICIRITIRRIVVAVLTASAVANLVIAGVVFGADSAPMVAAVTSTLNTPLVNTTPLTATATTVGMYTSNPSQTPVTISTDMAITTEVSVEQAIWIVCIKRFYWPTYRVQPGDTLFSLAAVMGTSVNELRSANCLANDQIHAGQYIYVPLLLSTTTIPMPTYASTPTDTPSLTPTAILTNTDLPTSTPTYTPTPSLTYTPPLRRDTPTIFEGRDAYPLCDDLHGINFSVTPLDLEGIGFVTVLYTIEKDLLTEISMTPDGSTYYASGTSINNPVSYFFRAIDNLGNITDSDIHEFSTACPITQAFHYLQVERGDTFTVYYVD
jgi:hypothetical protein